MLSEFEKGPGPRTLDVIKREHPGEVFNNDMHPGDKNLPTPKVCADCGGFILRAFDSDARQYFDGSTSCRCREGSC
jgi:hypothetical protein